MRKFFTWLGVAAAAVIAILIELLIGERKKAEGAKDEAATQAEKDKIHEAAKKGDLGTLDDEWRKGR